MYSTTIVKNSGIPLFSSVSRSSRCSPLPSSSSKLRSFSCGFSQSDANVSGEGKSASFLSGCRQGRRPSFRFIRFQQSRYFSSLKSPLESNSDVKFGGISNGSRLRVEEITCGVRTRSFSVGAYQTAPENDGGEYDGGRLPWLSAAYGGSKKKKKNVDGRTSVKSNKSSWEESASRYFSKNGSKLIEQEKDDSEGFETLGGQGSNAVRTYESERRDAEEEEEEYAGPISDLRSDRIRQKYQRFAERDHGIERPEVTRWKKQDSWGKKTWREAAESSVPKMVGEGVYGVGPILAALTVGRRDFYALYVQEGLELNGSSKRKKRKDKKGVESILKMAENMGVPMKETSKHDLNMIVDNRPHQGMVLDASPLEMVTIKELDPVSGGEGGKAPLWVALDEVTDPQNLGAILRSSYFFGVEGVVVCAKNSAPLSGVVSKASAGALELIELRTCKNMMQFLTLSAVNGWRVLGGSISSKAVPLNEVQPGVPTILVLGSEGTGLRPLVERSCTQLIKIPGKIPVGMRGGKDEEEGNELDESSSGQEFSSFIAVESLNVSVATGVLLYHLVGNSYNHVVDK